MVTCPGCGVVSSENVRFCSSCGRAVALLDTPTLEPDRGAVIPTPGFPSWHPPQNGGFSPGTILIERYRIVALLGRGGMGEVYRAEDLKLGNVVALKFLPASLQNDAAALAGFHAEVRNARQVSHPNVCRVYDIGEVNGQHFFTMEYIDGEDLASLLRRIGRLPADKALETAHQICAGLAAAHDCGLLHRDLKPANIMLDGRGRVRITDFGLALSSADASGRTETAGTPAYMAPEQIGKGESSVCSDIYSLGLVFYELFTGRMPYRATTAVEWRRAHLESSPRSPSSLVKDIDPVVEAAILRCLQKDPAQRPSSVRMVAAAFPGSDALTAALAAGETPSPEMVAAAGDEGVLRPRTAWILLFGTLVALFAIVMLAPYGTDLGLAPMEKTPEELEGHAKDIIGELGYSNHPADSASWIRRDDEYLNYRAVHEPSREWYRTLAASEFGPLRIWYRQSPELLVPLRMEPPFGLVSAVYGVKETDPPLDVSGMVTVSLNFEGRLLGLRAVAPQIDDSPGPPTKPDWGPLFAAAGLDERRFATATPRWVPPVPFDDRGEWDGTSVRAPGIPIHITAAAFRGKPVFFDIVGPWTRPTRMQDSSASLIDIIAYSVFVSIILTLLVSGIIFARRNIHRGRGDRRGAMQLFMFTFSVTYLLWVLWGHFVPDLSGEFAMFFDALAESLLPAAFVWVSYMALEPYVRRHWPRMLISWARLSSGKVRDPLLGRDLLAGTMVGAILAGLHYLEGALPYWTNVRGFIPFAVDPNSLRDSRRFAGIFVVSLQNCVFTGLEGLALLFLVRTIVRKNWLATVITGLVLISTNLSGHNILFDLPITATQIALALLVLIHFGFLAYGVIYFVFPLVSLAPITLTTSHWYAGRSIFVLLLVVGLALSGFRLALAGRPALGNLALDD